MKQELENIKPQQYPGPNIADMSLDVTCNCQALTTAGIWDHQICLSILSAFLLTDGDEMYCHSLITMKATLEDELKKVRFMEHAAGTAHLNDKGLTYANICDLAETWYQEARVWVSGLLPHMPKTPRYCLLPLPKLKFMSLFNVFRRVKPLPSHATRAMTLAIFVERKDIGPTNVQTRLTSQ